MERRVYIFCQKPNKLSHEHVLSEPLRKISIAKATYTMKKNEVYIDDYGDPQVDREVKRRNGVLSHMHTRRVCEICNNTWMSNLEKEIAPLILRLGRGQTTMINDQQISRMALWAAKTCVTSEYARGWSQTACKEDRVFMFSEQLPPEGWFVSIANYRGTLLDRTFSQYVAEHKFEIDERVALVSFSSVNFAVGSVLFHVSWTNNPGVGIGCDPRHYKFANKMIWPKQGVGLFWPTSPMIDDSYIEHVLTSNYRNLVGMGANLPPLPPYPR